MNINYVPEFYSRPYFTLEYAIELPIESGLWFK
jgi:hypothetical protein